MKLRVIFLKRKYIYIIVSLLIIVASIMAIIVFNFANSDTVETFNVTQDNLICNLDLTGDGNKDILYVKNEAGKYYIEVNTNGNSFRLKPDLNINTLGNYNNTWPMKITFQDINRDNIPEIFIQSSATNQSLQYCFMWTKHEFKEVFSSKNNLVGYMDSHNNKTPKLISGNYSNRSLDFNYFILLKDSLEKYNYSYGTGLLGKDTIMTFIKYIEAFPGSEAYTPKDIFYPSLSGNDLSVLGKIAAENVKLKFQDGVFMDTNWNVNGDATDVNWTLNFKATSLSNKNTEKECILELNLKYCKSETEMYLFKINKLSLKN